MQSRGRYKLGFVFVILSVAKDLKQHKVKMCETRFFA